MKRFAPAAVALALFAAGCDETLNPTTPTPGQVTLASQLSAAAEVPPAGQQGNPAGALEAGATGGLSVTMVPSGGGAYSATFTFSIGNLIKAGVLPAPLDSGSTSGIVLPDMCGRNITPPAPAGASFANAIR